MTGSMSGLHQAFLAIVDCCLYEYAEHVQYSHCTSQIESPPQSSPMAGTKTIVMIDVQGF